jgi:hypothetical protein
LSKTFSFHFHSKVRLKAPDGTVQVLGYPILFPTQSIEALSTVVLIFSPSLSYPILVTTLYLQQESFALI